MIEGEVAQVLDALREAGTAADIVEQCLPVLVAEARLGAIVSVVTGLVTALVLGLVAHFMFRWGSRLRIRSKDASLTVGGKVNAEIGSGGLFFTGALFGLLATRALLAALAHLADVARPHMVVMEWLLRVSP